jgi:hypothetical protein
MSIDDTHLVVGQGLSEMFRSSGTEFVVSQVEFGHCL